MPQAKKPDSSGAQKRSERDAALAALTSVPTSPDEVAANFAILRDRLLSSLTLTTERLQDTVDDAVRRGRMTRKDAEDLLSALIAAGRTQTEALLADVEQLLGRGPASAMRVRTADHAEAVRRTVDAARRKVSAGGKDESGAASKPKAKAEPKKKTEAKASSSSKPATGGGLPIAGYDELTAAEIVKRVKDLTPAQLRKVRDYEKAHANRKSVVGAVEKKLA
jgi:polyhydroxyalkanoate synthesis regulator phasin